MIRLVPVTAVIRRILLTGPALALVVLGQGPDYETEIKPILRTNCVACHSPRNLTSGLSLATRDAIAEGGNRGSALELILPAVRQQGALKMPPGGKKLSDMQIAKLEQWIAAGAPMPTPVINTKRAGEDHWAFRPIQRAAPPAAGHPIDAFVHARLVQEKLTPSPEADRATLVRRVSLDLIGLPPTPAESQAFIADTRPDAYERLVDRLLASPHYGERWGRVWLDLARYSDSDGYTIDAPRDIWKYRDWMIAALNRDQPFDQFVIEQLAGDLLPNPTNEQLIATGFHRNTPSNYEGGIDFEQYRVEAVADRINTNGSVFLGLTLGCARCHDHKYDPISQREYYRLFAIFNNIDEVDKEADRKYFNKPFLELGTPEQVAAHAAWEEKMQDLDARLRKYLESITGDAMADPKVGAMRKDLDQLRREKPKFTRTLIMRELAQPRQSYIHLGGDFTRRGVNVTPGTPAILPPNGVAGRPVNRLDFARWLFRPDHPLTARVTVNRIWQKYFGRGFVNTENDLGLQGDAPTHPELLDYLSREFIDRGWSQKALHRMIVTSAVYRQSSNARPDAARVDPDNKLLARQNRLTLDAELIRDSSLVAAGLLTATIGGPSVYPPIPAGANSVTQVLRPWETSPGPDRYRRGLYTFHQRSAPHPALVLFDAPDGGVTCTRRVRSNSPLQALMMLNDETASEFARALAARSVQEAPTSDSARIRHLYQLALNRLPSDEELAKIRDFVQSKPDSWTAVARALLNVDEFLTRP